MKTPQIDTWAGDFGRQYTDRNETSLEQMNALCHQNFGLTRTQINADFLAGIAPAARILEVGCNIGNQLLCLQGMGFQYLHGIEIQEYAIERARKRVVEAELKLANAFEIPYPDNYFDLVFTSGVLIHIDPRDLPTAISEIHRCTKKYIYGFEYYAPQVTEVEYRGSHGLLWKMDYAKVYMDKFVDLELLKEKRLPYSSGMNVDTVFLLHKKNVPQG